MQDGRGEEAIADWTRAAELPGAPVVVTASARGCLGTVSFNANQWGDGVRQLRSIINEGGAVPRATAVITHAAIMAVFRQFSSPTVYQAQLAEIVSIYRQHGSLPHLGDALVRHLAELAKSPLNNTGLDQWRAAWEQATSQDEAMRLPLRLLRVGIAYLKTEPRNETVLLELPKEERLLVREALGLPTEQVE